MLIKNAIIEKIKSGEITLIFRRWKRAGVKAGGTQMTQLGVIGIDSVDVVTERKITERDARAAGYESKKALLADLYDRDEDIYRIGVRWAGEDPRKSLRTNDKLTKAVLDEIIAKLRKLDAGSQRGNWTQQYLQMIRDQPNTHAAILAESIGLTIPTFKPWVRKLKALGLTESLRPGYRLSPEGGKFWTFFEEVDVEMNYDFYADRDDAVNVLGFIFAETDLCLFDLYSDYGKEVKKYSCIEDALNRFEPTVGQPALHFQMWAPRHGGTPKIRKLNIDPIRCEGHTFRYRTEGWGMIQLYFYFPNKRRLSPSHIGHFEESGAFARAGADGYEEVAEWNWPEIRRSSRKLQYHIRKKLSLSKTGSRDILPGAKKQFDIGIDRLQI